MNLPEEQEQEQPTAKKTATKTAKKTKTATETETATETKTATKTKTKTKTKTETKTATKTDETAINNQNGFGFETITHILEDPEFLKKMRRLMVDNEEAQAIIEMYRLVRLDPKNHNLFYEKTTSRVIYTHDETGKKIKKTPMECYTNIMIKLKELLMNYLEQTRDVKFKLKTIVRTNIIKHLFDIDKDQEFEDSKDDDDRLEDERTINEIKNGFVGIIRGDPFNPQLRSGPVG